MRSRSWAALFACLVLSGCGGATSEAVDKMDPSIPKFHTLECEAARQKALDSSGGLAGREVLALGLAFVPLVGGAGAIAVEQWEGNDTQRVWETLTKACGEESVLPFIQDKAEKGNEVAQALLAQAYARGMGLKKDPAEAAHWYAIAAAGGDTDAQVNLGAFYAGGFGVPKNEQVAANLWAGAAQQGVPEAETNLANFYLEGKGVLQDFKEAQKLFHKAALQGHGTAQFGLAGMYEKGLGIRQSDMLAYEWYSMAARNQVAAADEKRAEVAKRLSAEQQQRGDNQAGLCISSRYKYCP